MAKKTNNNNMPENFKTTVENGNLTHSVTSKGEKVMEKMSTVFEFGFHCASVRPVADTRITELKERYTFFSEDLADIETQLTAARSGQRLAYDVFTDLNSRAKNLHKKNGMLAAFWSPEQDDGPALKRRDAAHDLLKQMLDPESVLANKEAEIVLGDGQVVTHPIRFEPVESSEQIASVPYGDNGAKTLARAIHLATTNVAHWFEGRGVLFLRPVDANGKDQDPIFVGADNAYTVLTGKTGMTTFKPFSKGYDPTVWQLAALLVMGKTIDVVMTDTSLYDAPVFRNRVADQVVKAEFIDAFGKWVLPFTKKEFIEARYPQDPIKGLLATPVVAAQEREVFEF
jgi:hypothetical protein